MISIVTELFCDRVQNIGWRRIVLALASAFAASFANAQSVSEIESNPSAATVVAYCNPTRLGQVVAEIRWPIKSPPMGGAAARKMLQGRKLSATTYENGFAEGRAVDFRPFTTGRADAFAKARPEPKSRLVGLDRLTLVDTSTSNIAPRRAPLMARPNADVEEYVAFVVEGLQPGMRYFWSLSGAGESPQLATVLAPVCPVDEVSKERRR